MNISNIIRNFYHKEHDNTDCDRVPCNKLLIFQKRRDTLKIFQHMNYLMKIIL